MINKKLLGVFIVCIAVGLFLFTPQLVNSQSEPVDVEVLVSPSGLNTNGDLYDGKIQLSLVVASAPTTAFSGIEERVYLHHVIVDINRPAKIDDHIADSIWAEEAQHNRNVTKMFWVDGRRIFRSGN